MENKKNLKNTEAQEFTFHKVSTVFLVWTVSCMEDLICPHRLQSYS